MEIEVYFECHDSVRYPSYTESLGQSVLVIGS